MLNLGDTFDFLVEFSLFVHINEQFSNVKPDQINLWSCGAARIATDILTCNNVCVISCVWHMKTNCNSEFCM